MRTKTKVVGWCSITAVALMMCTGCAIFKSAEERNEVVYEFRYKPRYPDGFSITCIEQISVSTDNAVKTSDVCIVSEGMLQMYRIEGDAIKNYYWSDYLLYGIRYLQEDDKKQAAWKECEALINKMFAMLNAHQQLSTRLEQSETYSQPLGRGPVVTVTGMARDGGNSSFVAKKTIHWSNWVAWQGAGIPDGVPAEIEAFRQNATQVASVPKYARYYRSYLRAIPLFTKEEIEAEKDTPLLDLEQTRYQGHFALRHPYLLIPISGRGTPFYSTARKYTPGDKFKVQDGDAYFLIETFKGNR